MDKNDLPGLSPDTLKDIEERLKDLKTRTTEFVKEHPMTSVAIAVGIGYIIAKLISGRRK